MIDTTEGARIWTGHGVLAHNLTKIAPWPPERPGRHPAARQPGNSPTTQSSQSDAGDYFRANC